LINSLGKAGKVGLVFKVYSVLKSLASLFLLLCDQTIEEKTNPRFIRPSSSSDDKKVEDFENLKLKNFVFFH
jgi:hypothetical protein